MSQYAPPTCQGGPGVLQDQEHGVVLHDLWEKVINHPQLLEVGVAEYPKTFRRKEPFPPRRYYQKGFQKQF